MAARISSEKPFSRVVATDASKQHICMFFCQVGAAELETKKSATQVSEVSSAPPAPPAPPAA